jgi:hypothetical protein
MFAPSFRSKKKSSLRLMLLIALALIFVFALDAGYQIKLEAATHAIKETASDGALLYERAIVARALSEAHNNLNREQPATDLAIPHINEITSQVITRTAQNLSVFGSDFDPSVVVAVLSHCQDSDSPPTLYYIVHNHLSPEQRDLFFQQTALGACLLNHEISHHEYRMRKQQLSLREEALIHQMAFLNQADNTASSDDLVNEVLALKKEIQELRAAPVRYPPEFWLALAVALCSWLGMITNTLWSYRNDRRQQKEIQGLKVLQADFLQLQKQQLQSQIQTQNRLIISEPPELRLVLNSLLYRGNLSTPQKK